MIDRRRLVLATAAFAAVPALAQTKEPVTLITGFGYLPNFIEMMNAVSGGHLAREGFAPTLIGARGTSQAIQQLVAGQADVIRSAAIDQIRATAATGAPLVAIATLYQASPFLVVSHKDKPIAKAEDFAGKTVGLVSVGGTTEILLDLMLRKVGVARDSVKRETTGDTPAAFEIMRQGRVDCFMVSINAVAALEATRAPVEVWSTDRYAPLPGQVYMTARALIDTAPDKLTRIVRALKNSATEVLSQPLPPIYQRAQKDFDIPGLKDLDAAAAVQRITMDRLWLSQGRDNFMRNVPALWESGVSLMRDAGMTTIADAAALYTNRFVDAA